MKFINYLKSIGGVEIYPMISLMVFLIFFVILIVYVAGSKKEYIAEMSKLPLDDNNEKN